MNYTFDKLRHYNIAFAFGRYLSILGFTIIVIAAILKELRDLLGYGTADVKDFYASFLGALHGLLFIENKHPHAKGYIEIIRVKFKLFKFVGITLAPFFIIISEDYYSKKLIRHEKIHWEQQRKLWYIGFYILYLIDWLTSFKYRDICFEIEAYDNETYLEYTSPYTAKNYFYQVFNRTKTLELTGLFMVLFIVIFLVCWF